MNEQVVKPKSPAKSARRRSRELAVQGVYQWRLTGEDSAQIEKQIREGSGSGRYDVEFFKALLLGTLLQRVSLEKLVGAHIDRPMHELSPIEFSILLLGAYEFTHHVEIPYRVIINESVELTKTFGGTDGHKYVNGVLDKLAAQIRLAEIQSKAEK